MTNRQERFDLKISKLKILWKQRHLQLWCLWGKLKHIKINFKWTIPLKIDRPIHFHHIKKWPGYSLKIGWCGWVNDDRIFIFGWTISCLLPWSFWQTGSEPYKEGCRSQYRQRHKTLPCQVQLSSIWSPCPAYIRV